MEVKDYCKAMLAEVTAWKEKLEAMKKVADTSMSSVVRSYDSRADNKRKSFHVSWSYSANGLTRSLGAAGGLNCWPERWIKGWIDITPYNISKLV
jgi:hypothetical protein